MDELVAYYRDVLGFNPCFRGTCSWWPLDRKIRPFEDLVSILVFVELALDGNPVWKSFWGTEGVSILVFVELALDVHLRLWWRIWRNCFNPCFRGTCSWCIGSSLMAAHAAGFQSLFSWNLLLMDAKCAICGYSDRCFNPCFRGTCSWWEKEGAVVKNMKRFQSLFSWNLLLMIYISLF